MFSPASRTTKDPLQILRARLAAHCLHAQRDPKQTTAKARRAFLDSFLEKVDPDRLLPVAERQRRAESARKAHFVRLALASAKARRRRSGGRRNGDGGYA